MSCSNEIPAPSFEETDDSGSQPETLVDLEGAGGQGRKSRPRKDTKKDLKRKRQTSEPRAENSELPPTEAPRRPAAQKLTPAQQSWANLLAKLLRRNLVVTTDSDCSASKKNLLECTTDAIKDFLSDETLAPAGGSKEFSENMEEALGARLTINSVGEVVVTPAGALKPEWSPLEMVFTMFSSSTVKPPSGPA
jgi:hypothetical protein